MYGNDLIPIPDAAAVALESLTSRDSNTKPAAVTTLGKDRSGILTVRNTRHK